MITNQQFINLLNREVVPALGCTEPIAAALASAKAAEVLGSKPDFIETWVSSNILKNAMAVGIPGTGMTGLPIAVAIGALGGKSENCLEVLKGITQTQIDEARHLVNDGHVCIKHKEDADLLYIECICKAGKNTARVIIRHRHTNITYVERNGEILFESEENKPGVKPKKEYPEGLTVESIFRFATEIPFDEISFILEGGRMNRKVAEEGLKHPYGMQVGKMGLGNIEKGILSNDLLTYAMIVTSAASDARMDGCPLPVMSNSGSGNQGLVVSLPVTAIAEKLKSDDEAHCRALVLSHLIAIHIKSYLGQLSALCGVLVAATGASAGITYLLGGNYQQIVYAIKNMAGGITGMICDGAKLGCALKVSAGVCSAVQTALLAMEGIGISHLDGIIEKDIEKTIRNVGRIGSTGMVETDKLILHTMVCK
ncbi:MAG: L-serine ammonia-lyase, iron-sulfur-dependent, subunit alpha [Bacteroidota bacterium]|nr:L-serine ammonia-lyase, iron-sulfur-dependent, subunit alpha [Bacteroidota bacterium]